MELDHLLYVGPDLTQLTGRLSAASGLSASVGGRHLGQGTHNALLGLGPASYLELMAPDPQQAEPHPPSAAGAAPPGTFLRSIAYATTPQLFTWCATAVDAAACAEAARSLGLAVTLYQGSRLTPLGATLRWDLIIIGGHGLGGVVPFFIDWHDSPHPAASLRTSSHDLGEGSTLVPAHEARSSTTLELVELELLHPAADEVTELLAALDEASGNPVGPQPPLVVRRAAEPHLVAHLLGPAGPFELRGPGGQLVTTNT